MRRAASRTRRRSARASCPASTLPPSARAFLAAPDDAAIDADLAWIEAQWRAPRADHLRRTIRRCSRTSVAAPPVLYVLGDVAALSSPQLAMVGSRNPTASGRSTARDFATFFARAGLTITSGLALGIDAASHEGALERQRPHHCGVRLRARLVYPRQNAALAARIREHGALVSEFPPRTAAAAGPLPAAEPHHQRPLVRHAGRGSRAHAAARSSPRNTRSSRGARCSPFPARSTIRSRAAVTR